MKLWKIILGILGAVGALFAASSKSKEVKELNNFGANDCLIVKPTHDSVDEKERLIPFIKEKFIDSVDKKERVLKVYWQSDY